MFVTSILPDVAAMLPDVQFNQRLDVHIDVVADTDKPKVSVSADGRLVELPTMTAGEVPIVPVA